VGPDDEHLRRHAVDRIEQLRALLERVAAEGTDDPVVAAVRSLLEQAEQDASGRSDPAGTSEAG
jgi:hypothetical protein